MQQSQERILTPSDLGSDDRALLDAALLPWPQARAAWEAWRAQHSLQDLEKFSNSRVLPFLYQRFTAEGYRDPEQHLLKGSFQRTFYLNSIRFARLADLLRRLEQEGIATIVLKGCYLSLAVYPDPACRPMLDLDILVSEADLARTHEILCEWGWQISGVWYQEGAAEDPIRYLHRHGALAYLEETRSFDIDLHFGLLSGASSPAFRTHLWQHKKPFQVQGVKCFALSQEMNFLHCLVHGRKRDTLPSSYLYWMLDAVHILAAANSRLDWDEIVRWARREYQLTPLREGIEFLREAAYVDVPEQLIRSLAKQQPRLVERLDSYYERVGASGPLGSVPTRLANYLRRNRWGNRYRLSLLEWLAEIWELDDRRSVFKALPGKLLETLRRK